MTKLTKSTVSQHLDLILDRVKTRTPLYHTRYNDGEINQLLELLPMGTLASGNIYRRNLGEELRVCFLETCQDQSGGVLVGSILNTDPGHPTAKALADWLDIWNVDWSRVQSTVGEFWCQEEVLEAQDTMLALLEELRTIKRSILIGNETIAQARHCMGAEFLQVPMIDAWKDRERIQTELGECMNIPGLVYVWCAGIPAKVWSWRLFKEDPTSIHLDMGHTFDGIFGDLSRGWMTRDTPMTRYYFEEFQREVRRHIP